MMKYKNVSYRTLSTLMLHMFAYAFAPDGDLEMSKPVSAFVSTSSQKIKDRKMVLKIYEAEKDREQMASKLYKLALRAASTFGSPDPKPIANAFAAITKYYPAFSNSDLEVPATMYAIGKTLEDKDLLPDVDAAVEKANELIENVQARLDELSSDSYWGDHVHALIEGTDLFFKRNGNIEPKEFVLAYKRWQRFITSNYRK